MQLGLSHGSVGSARTSLSLLIKREYHQPPQDLSLSSCCCLYCTDVAPVDVSLNHHLNPLTKAVTGPIPRPRITQDDILQQQTAYVRVRRQPLNRARTRSQSEEDERTVGHQRPPPRLHLIRICFSPKTKRGRSSWTSAGGRPAASKPATPARSGRWCLSEATGNPVPDSYVHRPIFQARLRFALFSVVIGRLLTGSPVQL